MSRSASSLNWWYMLGSLRLMCSSASADLLLDPGDVEEHAAVRGAAAGLDLAVDAARHVVARQQLGRTAGALVALRVAPAFFRIGRRLRLVVVGDVVEHEAAAFAVLQHAAFAAHALGDEDALHARRPDHPGRMELDELHVDQLGAGAIGQRVAVAGAFPAVAGDLEGAADAAGGEDDRLGAERRGSGRARGRRRARRRRGRRRGAASMTVCSMCTVTPR